MKKGIFLAILAAALYAINAPFSKILLNYIEPTNTAAAVFIIIENAATDALQEIEKAKFCKGAVRQSRPARLSRKAAGMKKLCSNFEMECKALTGRISRQRK